MLFQTYGEKNNPAVLFFHAMGVTGKSSERVAKELSDRYYCIELQKNAYFEFGSIEDHYKYRDAVMKAYPGANYPVFEGYNHMQYQIRDPKGFSEMLRSVMEKNCLPNLPFLRK